VGGENKLFSSFMCRYVENGTRYDQLLVMTNRKLHNIMRFRLEPRSMTLDVLELLQVQIAYIPRLSRAYTFALARLFCI